MSRRDFSGEEVYRVLVNAGGFEHVRTTGDHAILRWDPPADHETTETRIVTVPLHDRVSLGTLRSIADDAGADDFESFCAWIDRHS